MSQIRFLSPSSLSRRKRAFALLQQASGIVHKPASTEMNSVGRRAGWHCALETLLGWCGPLLDLSRTIHWIKQLFEGRGLTHFHGEKQTPSMDTMRLRSIDCP
jgi:hypothetical protein